MIRLPSMRGFSLGNEAGCVRPTMGASFPTTVGRPVARQYRAPRAFERRVWASREARTSSTSALVGQAGEAASRSSSVTVWWDRFIAGRSHPPVDEKAFAKVLMELERAGGRGTQGASGALAAHDRIANRPFPPVVSRTDGGDLCDVVELFSRERCGVHSSIDR